MTPNRPFAVLVASAVVGCVALARETRPAVVWQCRGEPAAWISLDTPRVVFGSGRSATIVSAIGLVESRLRLDSPVVDGVLFSDRLYLNQAGGGLSVLDLTRPEAGTVPLAVDVRFAGSVRTARMGEHLIALEDGFGLRLLELPPPAGHRMSGTAHRGAEDVRAAGTLRIPASFTALGAAGTTILAATDDGRLIVIDASRTDAPRIERTLELGLAIDAVGASGDRVFLLHAAGLGMVDVSGGGDLIVRSIDPEIRGRALAVAGRRLHVAGDGVAVLTDSTEGSVTVNVTVSNNVFTPSQVTINPGDTVKWTNTAGFHNVESCDGVGDPAQCPGVAAQGFFTSGNAAFPPWTFSKTFTIVGDNPYFCEVHVGLGMTGTVKVAAAPPPGTPDGTGGSDPLAVAKAPAGPFPDRLVVSWDADVCADDAGYELLFGKDSDLPSTFTGTYGLLGQVCSIGTSGAFAWTTPPAPASGSFVWFLVVAHDAVTVEGSWGRNSGGVERKGPGAGGASGSCKPTKNLTNTCGQ